MMNDNWMPSDPLNASPAPDGEARKPQRRARRTLAPFSDKLPPVENDLSLTDDEEKIESEKEEVPAPAELPREESSVCADISAEEEDKPPVPAEVFSLSVKEEEESEEVVPAFAAAYEDENSEETESLWETAQPKCGETLGEDPEALESKEEEMNSAESPSDESELYNEHEAQEETFSASANVFDWIKSFLFSLTTVVFVFTLLFRGVTVNGGSMLPTLESNEYLIISNLFYTPKTGDIVVVQSPHYKDGTEPLIKRIIATGGQTVKIDFTSWQVWVDGELLKEDYILKDGASTMNSEDMVPDENGICEITVEENCIFVMGDHRNDSLDSRSESVGQIDERYIMGRVVIRITPLERFGKVD